LKINASNFFGRKAGGHVVKPRPACDSDPAADCPAGSSNSGFFKVWGQSTNYIWASWTSDHDAHAIYATFDTAGVYNMTIAARSSWCILDRMVLQLDGTVSDGTARDLDQPQSDCVARTTGLFDQAEHTLRLFPNPTTHTLNIENLTQPQAFEIWDVAGRMMQDGKVGLEGVISLRPELPNGVYLIKVGNQSGRFLKQ
ncbi:MAG: T9SS type A sorting domain-containing protein, partial [Bacteroidota bacterium]